MSLPHPLLAPCFSPRVSAEKQQLKELAASVDIVWHKRLAQTSPLQASLQQEQVDKALEAWIESQINHIDDKKCAFESANSAGCAVDARWMLCSACI